MAQSSGMLTIGRIRLLMNKLYNHGRVKPVFPSLTTSSRGEQLAPAGKKKEGQTLKRKRARTRQLQRGLVQLSRLRSTLELFQEEGAKDWFRLDEASELFQSWRSSESAADDVVMVLASTTARRFKKPQPFLAAVDAPLGKSYILLKGQLLTADWEQWLQNSPAAQMRPLIAKDRLLYVAACVCQGAWGRSSR